MVVIVVLYTAAIATRAAGGRIITLSSVVLQLIIREKIIRQPGIDARGRDSLPLASIPAW